MDYRRPIQFFASVAATISTTVAGASTPEAPTAVPQPGSGWEVLKGEQECHLVRQFQSAGATFWLDIVRGGGPEQLDMLLFGEGVPKVRADYYFWIGVTSAGNLRYFNGISGAIRKQPGRMLYVRDMPSRVFDNLAIAQALTLSTKKSPILTVDLPESSDAFVKLQSCYEELLRSWQVDPSKLAIPLTDPSEGNLSAYGNPGSVTALRSDLPKMPVDPNAWVQWVDYPTEALRREVSGVVVVALTVEPSGRATHCDIVVSSKFSDLDRTTCERMLARARYQPFTDHDAVAGARRAVERVRWIIPVPLP